MSEFIFHCVLLVRGKTLAVVGIFTSKSDAHHFADGLPVDRQGAPVVSACTIDQVKSLLLKERHGELHDALLRVEARLR